jgi:hypothetical protein
MEKRLSEYRADAQVLSPGLPIMTDITRYEKNLVTWTVVSKDTYPLPQHNTRLDSTRILAYTDPPGDRITFKSTLEH